MMKKKATIEEIKKNVIYDFIRYKAGQNPLTKIKVLDALKTLCKYYNVGLYVKVSEIDDFVALNEFIKWNKPAKQIINQIYSNL